MCLYRDFIYIDKGKAPGLETYIIKAGYASVGKPKNTSRTAKVSTRPVQISPTILVKK